MTTNSHRINLSFKRVTPSANVDELATVLESVFNEGSVEHGVPPFGSLRHSLRQDPSDKQNTAIIASFDFVLDAMKIPTSFDEYRAFWTDTEFWKGFECVAITMMPVFLQNFLLLFLMFRVQPIDLLWTFNFHFGQEPDQAYVDAFKKFGPCRVSRTATGLVLVKFDNVADAKQAAENLNNTVIDKARQPLLVDYATKSLRVLNNKKEVAKDEPKFTIRMGKMMMRGFFRHLSRV